MDELTTRKAEILAKTTAIRDELTTRKASILAKISAIQADRQSLTERLREKAQALADTEAARDKLQAFIATPDWASLDGSIDAGTVVRFGALLYRAKSTHTKALTRSPMNLIYWEVITDA